jgi:hypothetical protein
MPGHDDEAVLRAWSGDVVASYVKRSTPEATGVRRALIMPRWAVTVFVRKSREIGFSGALRLARDVAVSRLRAAR